MRFDFDPKKSRRLRANPQRGIGFEEAQSLFLASFKNLERGEPAAAIATIYFLKHFAKSFSAGLVLTLLASQALPQTGLTSPAENHAAFDVVSIRPSDPSMTTEDLNYRDNGQITAKGITVRFLIESAFDIRDFQLVGLPRSLADAKYDIIAKMDDPTPEGQRDRRVPEDQEPRLKLAKSRLQNLLVDRFRLRFHLVTKQAPIFALIVETRPPRPSRTPEDDGYLRMHHLETGEQIEAKGATMSELADRLSYVVSRKVVDQTNLKGTYDFELDWIDDEDHVTDGHLPSVFGALKEQLGLGLIHRTGMVVVYAIDHVEKPAPN